MVPLATLSFASHYQVSLQLHGDRDTHSMRVPTIPMPRNIIADIIEPTPSTKPRLSDIFSRKRKEALKRPPPDQHIVEAWRSSIFLLPYPDVRIGVRIALLQAKDCPLFHGHYCTKADVESAPCVDLSPTWVIWLATRYTCAGLITEQIGEREGVELDEDYTKITAKNLDDAWQQYQELD